MDAPAKALAQCLEQALESLAGNARLKARVRNGNVHELTILMGLVQAARAAGCCVRALELRASDDRVGAGGNDGSRARPPVRVQTCLDVDGHLLALDEMDGALAVRTWSSPAGVEQTLSGYPRLAWSEVDPVRFGDCLGELAGYLPLDGFKARLRQIALDQGLPASPSAPGTGPRL